ncbi:DUF1707 domain-containing protein [Streptomyces zagrosensis]|uniref:DUF1707 domain-containing protein n=1 Tax=Streptomyces zagrosensis TaxID=1042984 RepID=A0A7W9UXR3_9ACTN|nr:DUF1707 domain-containing protein [Streptomyces zagrosensis]MBB5935178.1 hypothetical protein [Streptomyces zagrosensis]
MSGELSQMRASDAERERVAEALREAVAEGRLDMVEFEERLERAYTARTHADLEPLVQDLPVPASAVAPVVAPGRPRDGAGLAWPERIGDPPTSRWGIAVMGGFQRSGGWVMPRAFTSVVLMGGGEIDLRDARFEDRDVVIRCFAFMGGVSVIVPPDVEVNVSGIGIMGGFDHTAAGEGARDAPRVTVTGLAIWGGVGIQRKRRKADVQREKEARRHEKAELKRMRKERKAGQPLGRGSQAQLDGAAEGERPGGADRQLGHAEQRLARAERQLAREDRHREDRHREDSHGVDRHRVDPASGDQRRAGRGGSDDAEPSPLPNAAPGPRHDASHRADVAQGDQGPGRKNL